MRVPFFRASVSLLVSTAVIAGSAGPLHAQGYDAEAGQFEVPETWDAPPEEPVLASTPWDPRGSGQAACDATQDFIKGQLMDVVAELPGGVAVKLASDFVLDPALAAATAEGEDGEQAGALIGTMMQNGAQLLVPELGIATYGGKLVIAGTEYTIQEAVAAVRDEEVAAFLTGYGGPLGSVGNIGAQVPFLPFIQNIHFTPPGGTVPVYPYRQITPDDLGLFYDDEQQLTEAWGLWRNNHDFIGRQNLSNIEALAWPRIQSMWRAQRLQIVVAQVERALRRAIAAMQPQIAAAQANGGSCSEPNTTLASAARRMDAQDPWLGEHTGVVDTPVTFEWDTRIRVRGIVCFGGAQTPLYFDHYHLNGQFVGADQREYYRVRNPASANGAFCGEWETGRNETKRGDMAGASASTPAAPQYGGVKN
jgi:hypothetical protein